MEFQKEVNIEKKKQIAQPAKQQQQQKNSMDIDSFLKWSCSIIWFRYEIDDVMWSMFERGEEYVLNDSAWIDFWSLLYQQFDALSFEIHQVPFEFEVWK